MNILLPIETINREIDFKIMLASILSGNDHKIFIGQHDFLMSLLPKMKGGIYIGKNVFSRRSDLEKGEKYSELKNQGFDIIYLHEEGAVYAGSERDWEHVIKKQYNLELFDGGDRVCVWGDFQKNIDLKRSNGLNIYVTGHPRFDLYKKEWNSYFSVEVDEIKSKYGDYVLINGNYGIANHGLGVSFVFSDNFNYVVNDISARINRVGFYSYSTKQLVSIVELTHHLAVRYPSKKFIYRPHPSENHDYYKAIFGGVDNILVNHEGPVGPWILGAEAVIHDGCTTAIEASLANVPVINYKPYSSDKHDIWLPNQLGKRASSVEEVCNIIDNIKKIEFNISDCNSYSKLKELFFNFQGDSFKEFIEVVYNKLHERNEVKHVSPSSTAIRAVYFKNKLKVNLIKFLNTEAAKNVKYHKIKFSGFDSTMISLKFEQAGKVLGKSVKFKIHNSYLIEIK